MNMKSNIQIQIENSQLEKIIHFDENSGKKNSGFYVIINSFIPLFAGTMRELRGKFTPEEIIFLADILNGTVFQPELCIYPSTLVAEIEDRDRYNNAGQLHNVDVPALIEKAKALTSAQSLCLALEINRWWNSENPQIENLQKLLS